VERTAESLGRDGDAYRRLIGGLVREWPKIEGSVLGPLRWPDHPVSLARFGASALRSAERVARRAFAGAPARGLLAGIAAHGMLPLHKRPAAAFALVLGTMAHTAGWVFPRGGAQNLTNALVSH